MIGRMDAIRQIQEVWGPDSVHEQVFSRLLGGLPCGGVEFLPARFLYTVAAGGRYPPSRDVYEAVDWFTGSELTLLEPRYELAFPDGTEVRLRVRDLREAMEAGSFLHPMTGEEYPYSLDVLFPYFVGNATLKGLLSDTASHGPA